MPIQMRRFGDRGEFRPVLTCLYCGKRITEDGNVIFNYDLERRTGLVEHFEFAHKGCDDANRGDDAFRSSEEIDIWLMKLVNMTQVDLQSAASRYGLINPDDPEVD